MRNARFTIILGLLISLNGIGYSADTLQDSPIYVTGGFSDPTWSPGSGAAPEGGTIEDLRLYDDGQTNGDAVADDGVWTCIVSGFGPYETIDWKISSPGWSPINAPDSAPDNLSATADENGSISFFFDTNPQNDGLLPDVGQPNNYGFAYSGSTWDAIQPIELISLTGDFQIQLGGAADWDPTDFQSQILLYDDGNNYDEVAGDDIFTGSVTGLEPGIYEYQGVIELEDFTLPKFTAIGFSTAERNMKFNVLDSAEIIVFQCDGKRLRIGPVAGEAAAGPPFFAHSEAWGEGYTELEDIGKAIGSVYYKEFIVAEPGNYTLRIRDKSLKEYPYSGNYPFTTTEANQEVLVIFDCNQYDDGYEPSTNIVFIIDNVTKQPLNEWEYIQLVGDCMIDFGGESDWNASDEGFMAFDDGSTADGDVIEGDGVYTVRLETTATASNKLFKAVGRRLGMEDGEWDIQIGGPGEGITYQVTNNLISFSYTPGVYTFQIDTLTGRVGLGDEPPARPSLEIPVAVNGWELH